MSSTRTLVTLLSPWIRRFTIIISAWWLRTSSKFTWEEVKTSTGKLGKWSTPKRVRIRPKHSAPSLSRDRRIKMHQSINQSINFLKKTDVFKSPAINNFVIPPLFVTLQILLLKTPLFHQYDIYGFKQTSKHKQDD